MDNSQKNTNKESLETENNSRSYNFEHATSESSENVFDCRGCGKIHLSRFVRNAFITIALIAL